MHTAVFHAVTLSFACLLVVLRWSMGLIPMDPPYIDLSCLCFLFSSPLHFLLVMVSRGHGLCPHKDLHGQWYICSGIRFLSQFGPFLPVLGPNRSYHLGPPAPLRLPYLLAQVKKWLLTCAVYQNGSPPQKPQRKSPLFVLDINLTFCCH